jgi:hypothetical protein
MLTHSRMPGSRRPRTPASVPPPASAPRIPGPPRDPALSPAPPRLMVGRAPTEPGGTRTAPARAHGRLLRSLLLTRLAGLPADCICAREPGSGGHPHCPRITSHIEVPVSNHIEVPVVRKVISPERSPDRFSDPRRALIGGVCHLLQWVPLA